MESLRVSNLNFDKLSLVLPSSTQTDRMLQYSHVYNVRSDPDDGACPLGIETDYTAMIITGDTSIEASTAYPPCLSY